MGARWRRTRGGDDAERGSGRRDRLEEERGTVVLKSSRTVRVETARGTLLCSLRGRFRARGEEEAVVPVVGDRVVISRLDDAEGILERILPRSNELCRATAGGRVVLVAANVDRTLVMVASREPPPRWALVDRMLVAAHRDDIEPGVCLNKWDQADSADRASLEETLAVYRDVGYPVFTTSATDGYGLDALQEWLRGKVTAFAGHSGVGKSTLLNRLEPALALETQEVNVVTGKGRHTTTSVRLLPLPFGGHALDTPGFREFQPVDLSPPELGRHYPELRQHVSRCRFKDCLHTSEPSCEVRSAVERGEISKLRYGNYLQVLQSLGRR